ncbi:MAG TPA: tetratricopeptide repeat protein [Verrucomicrobiae bacterium]|nr:tetratricopeptide repeat protein [Verrucomicrobiae bacterium]
MKAQRFIPLVVIAAGLLAYQDSFTGEFVHDDLGSILENPTIRHLWPIWQSLSPPHRGGLTVEGRPLINLSLAVNYALGGYNVWGYHALNLAVHILAGLTLLGIVRRTLLQPPLRGRFGAAANELALAVAVLWTVHPLQTESVAYVIQRAESIMGLFYLLTLYCFIRGTESPTEGDGKWFTRNGSWGRLWYGLSVTACGLGMASKEVMVSAPLMVALYDRAFLSPSFREAWRRRWPLYLALASTWVLLGFVLAAGQVPTTLTIARRLGFTWWQYLATQPGVILYYVRLTVWPSPLCVCHPWPIAKTWTSVLPSIIVVVILVAASAWAWRRHPVWGFVGAWFFIILAPSSSFIPLRDPLYEHRMYLSLAVVVSLVVVGLYWLAGRRSLVVFVAAAIGLGLLTWRRNPDYRSEVALWADAVAKFPNDLLLRNNLGIALTRAGRFQEAIGRYEEAIRLQPQYADAHYNLGIALERSGRLGEAIAQYEQALHLRPDDAEGHYNLGVTLQRMGRVQEALGHYERALQLRPGYAEAHYNLGIALARSGRVPEAVGHFEEAVRLKPDLAEAHYSLGLALAKLGRVPEAEGQWEEALRIKPDYAEAHVSLGIASERAGRMAEAKEHYEQALRINPRMVEAQNRLARLQAVQ